MCRYRHGKGKYVYAEFGAVYFGSWVQNLRHGHGVVEWHDNRK